MRKVRMIQFKSRMRKVRMRRIKRLKWLMMKAKKTELESPTTSSIKQPNQS